MIDPNTGRHLDEDRLAVISIVGMGDNHHTLAARSDERLSGTSDEILKTILSDHVDARCHQEIEDLYGYIGRMAKESLIVSWAIIDQRMRQLRITGADYDIDFGNAFIFYESGGLPDPISAV
ncbi:hypothetical protein [Rhizobium sp. RAF56]|uniref:hypothetical protein n=1 Tax=Rhizobium sp. RAF56 TaxID=3233062 RepID=UPI003F99A13F